MKVQVIDSQKCLAIDLQSVAPLVEWVLSLEEHVTDELFVYFVDEQQICELHERYFGDPSPTDCISFPLDQSKEAGWAVLGEIFISPKAALDFISKKGLINEQNLYRELSLYLLHGILHLLGYDDLEPTERLLMRKAERRIMKDLLKKNLLLRP